jgi:hypothetical protein
MVVDSLRREVEEIDTEREAAEAGEITPRRSEIRNRGHHLAFTVRITKLTSADVIVCPTSAQIPASMTAKVIPTACR